MKQLQETLVHLAYFTFSTALIHLPIEQIIVQ